MYCWSNRRRAAANNAAVNYHFGGKHGLYVAVMNAAINTMQATTAAAREAGAGLDGQIGRAHV